MIKIILHQIWNQKQLNAWIFIELVIAGFLIWTVIDPICMITADKSIPKGYNSENLFVLNFGQYDDSYSQYDASQDSSEIQLQQFRSIVSTLKNCPEVKNVAITAFSSFPNSSSWSGTAIMNEDSVNVHVQHYAVSSEEGYKICETLGMIDANTNKELILPEDFFKKNMIAISENTAMLLYGTTDVVSKKIIDYEYNKEIGAVFKNIKNFDYEQPYRTIISSEPLKGSSHMTWNYNIIFRLKDNITPNMFIERFEKEVVQHINIGNFFYRNIKSFDEFSHEKAVESGILNKLRLKYSLAGFAVLCIFIGMIGTFWIRCNARREDIGIMRSIGASKKTIIKQFLLEASLLATMAFIISLLFTVNYVYTEGFADTTISIPFLKEKYIPDHNLWQNNPYVKFIVISAITYILILITAVTGTYIPVRNTLKKLPVEALREE